MNDDLDKDNLIVFLEARFDETPDLTLESVDEVQDYVERDIEAKRQILKIYQDVNEDMLESPPADQQYLLGQVSLLKMVLIALASAYSEHPDYQTSWRFE